MESDIIEKTLVNLNKALAHYDTALAGNAGSAVARSEGATIVHLLTMKKHYEDKLEELTKPVAKPRGNPNWVKKETN